jgi:hypothetical protein
MHKLIKWLRGHSYETYWLVFLLMITPPILLYRTAERGATLWTWLLLGIVVFANLLILFLR